MNPLKHSKQAILRYESELIHTFTEFVKEVPDPDLVWTIPIGISGEGRLPWVELSLDGHPFRFEPFYSLKPSIPELDSLLAGWKNSDPPLLVVPDLTSRVLDHCRRSRLAAIDLNGRVYLRAPQLLVDRRPLPGRNFRFELEPRNVFVGKSCGIIRSLLTNRDRLWAQSELVSRTYASSGLVSRIVQHLVSQGFLEKQSAREFRLIDLPGLVDAWVKADEFGRRNATTRYTAFGGSPFESARQLKLWAEQESVRIAFTQWIAGYLRRPYTEPVITSAYVSRLPDATTLERLGLRPVSEAGKVWLHLPDDEGVFLETRSVQDLPVVSDAQIYLDLQNTGLRGPDQAAAIREWEGFCRL